MLPCSHPHRLQRMRLGNGLGLFRMITESMRFDEVGPGQAGRLWELTTCGWLLPQMEAESCSPLLSRLEERGQCGAGDDIALQDVFGG